MDIKLILPILATLFIIHGCIAELKLVQVVFRHGNRTPARDTKLYYPFDPHRNETYYPEGWGGLTNAGKKSVYNLGKCLRSRYGSLLGPIYTPNIVRFQADEVERIIMSAQVLSTALFPPTKLQRWHRNIMWQPIPIWTEPIEVDYLYNGMYCTNFDIMKENVEKTDPKLIERNEQLKSFYEYMSKHTGTNMTHFTCFLLHQNLHAQMDLGLELPEWTKSVFPNGRLSEVAMFDLVIQSYTPAQKQLMGGPWVEEWLKHIDNHLNVTSPDTRKAHIYAVHEMNIAGILNALNVFDNQIPKYSSAVIFELHKENEEYFVQMLYRNENNVRPLTIPGCENTMCPLPIFRQVVEPLRTDDLPKLCGEIFLRG